MSTLLESSLLEMNFMKMLNYRKPIKYLFLTILMFIFRWLEWVLIHPNVRTLCIIVGHRFAARPTVCRGKFRIWGWINS